MEIKFRQKGQILKEVGFWPEETSPLNPPEGLEGIDLTCYSVIFMGGGKYTKGAAYRMAAEVTHAIVAYKYEWRNGYGAGILLPKGFDPSRVRFYKTELQAKEEDKEEAKEAALNLGEVIEASIPCVRARLNVRQDAVEVTPLQEAYCVDWGWAVLASSLEEALAGVARMRTSLWEEWNSRAVATYAAHSPSGEKPGEGSIQISPSPVDANRVGISLDSRMKEWAIFRRGEGGWEEEEWTNSSPPAYVK